MTVSMTVTVTVTMSRMRGHDEDVYSVAWSPGDNTRIGEDRSGHMIPSCFYHRDRIFEPLKKYSVVQYTLTELFSFKQK